ncbi:MAG: class I SAM-dependent methyltransferase [Minisyncoccales bacterium]
MPEFINPEKVLDQLNLRAEMIAADFGCGSGGWAIPLAKRLSNGLVYAIDILNEPLSALKSKAKWAKVTNIRTILSDVERVRGILDRSCDLVLMTNLLFQCENKKKILAEAKRVLKNNGLILVVDWKKEARLDPNQIYVSPDEVKKIAQELNLVVEKEFDISTSHYGIILKKEEKL